MNVPVDIMRVARAFARTRATYDQHAIIQREMARKLVEPLRNVCPKQIDRLLELGCGTGLVTRELARTFKLGHCTVNDLVPIFARDAAALLEQSGALSVNCLPGDIEAIGGYPQDQSLIVSGAAFQWLRNLENLLERMVAHLQPGGVLAFSTFGPENLREVRASTGLGLDYPSLGDLRTILAGHAEIHVANEWCHAIRFDSAMALLRHLQRTGVNGLAGFRWTPRKLGEFCADFERTFPYQGGVRLTYHPVVIVARKAK